MYACRGRSDRFGSDLWTTNPWISTTEPSQTNPKLVRIHPNSERPLSLPDGHSTGTNRWPWPSKEGRVPVNFSRGSPEEEAEIFRTNLYCLVAERHAGSEAENPDFLRRKIFPCDQCKGIFSDPGISPDALAFVRSGHEPQTSVVLPGRVHRDPDPEQGVRLLRVQEGGVHVFVGRSADFGLLRGQRSMFEIFEVRREQRPKFGYF